MAEHEEQAERTIVTAPGDREIRVERVFDAPPDRVFAATTEPEAIEQWWGPLGTTAVVERMDVRPGGAWRFVLREPDGGESAFHGTFREVVAPERIVQTFEWEGMPGHVSVETATYEDLGGRTRLVTTSVFPTREERDGMLASGREQGMRETYGRLDDLLARGG
jgi:uncharacterized protein YndB with AHSA1/START domain